MPNADKSIPRKWWARSLAIILIPFRSGWLVALGTTILLSIMLAALFSVVSNPARPGDSLYGVDRTFEKIRLAIALSDSAQYQHSVSITQERLEELISFDLDDIGHILLSIDETQAALQELRSNIESLDELKGVKDEAIGVVDSLLELMDRYRDFLLGEEAGTTEIQEEIDKGIEEIRTIVSSISAIIPPSDTTTEPTTLVNPQPKEPDAISDECNTNFEYVLSNGEKDEVEYKNVTILQNECSEFYFIESSKQRVLVTNDDLSYALNQQADIHGFSGTDNSVFLTEIEVDD